MPELWAAKDAVNRKFKELWAAQDGTNRKLKELWASQGGVNRKIFSGFGWIYSKNAVGEGNGNYLQVDKNSNWTFGYDVMGDDYLYANITLRYDFSDPIQITSINILDAIQDGNYTNITDILETYYVDTDGVARVDDYLGRNVVAIYQQAFASNAIWRSGGIFKVLLQIVTANHGTFTLT